MLRYCFSDCVRYSLIVSGVLALVLIVGGLSM